MTRQEFNHQLAQYKHTVRSGSGLVTLDGGIKCYLPSVKFYGACAQDGTPTPEAPVPVKCNNSKWTTPVWNQIVPNGSFESTSYWTGIYGSFNVENNVATFVASSTIVSTGLRNFDVIRVVGHKYLAICDVRLIVGSTNAFAIYIGDNIVRVGAVGNEWVSKSTIATAKEQSSLQLRINQDGPTVGDTMQVKNVMVFDLTQMFGAGNEPTTVEEFRAWAKANGHDIDTYQPYDEGSPIGGTVDLSLLPDGGLYGIGNVRDEWDAATGKGIRRYGKINSYAGETVGDNWISSTGALTTGATVIYELSEPVPFTATPQPIIEQNGSNQLSQTDGDIDDTEAEATFVTHS